ncbi:MAG TPA: FAD-binding oxidoreductase [Solirubrobacteraceae bacterium]|nr:FAD-binding oxidoreductase [Solirubrobacteraceae bacterium]
MNDRRRKHWGWGYEDEQTPLAEQRAAAPGIAAHLGFGSGELEEPCPLEQVELAAPRLAPPAALAEICSSEDYDRALHSYGRAYRDIVRAFRGRFDHPPDVVAHPRDEREVEAVLEWCDDAGAALIPFGGGTSVVGGVEPRVSERYAGTVSLDLKALDRVLEVDSVSRAARIQAGALGPQLETQLAGQGLTLRHFPQSFQFSTLGGWIATRAGGHFATLYTHIDDLVESIRAISPAGAWESFRLPGSGAGPSPDRMLLGSEGTLGVITEAWVRLQDKPVHRRSTGVSFADFFAGAEAVRALAQTKLYPTNCRLIDAAEAALTGAGDGEHALLVLGFESADHPVDEPMALALAICAEHGGTWTERTGGDSADGGAVSSWRDAFLRAPYIRDTFIAMGVLSDTFETAITWDRFEDFVATARAAAEEGLRAHAGGAGTVTCRLTHVYPDGAAPYFTVMAPAERGGELEQWDAIKQLVSDAVNGAGGTITHHHAVGRDHRPWYDRQRPDPFALALRGAKATLDPKAILNPGVLIDP